LVERVVLSKYFGPRAPQNFNPALLTTDLTRVLSNCAIVGTE